MTARLRQLVATFPLAVRKLDPRHTIRQPVVFVVWVSSAVTTVAAIVSPSGFAWLVTVWLWATVFFAAMAEAVAEGRGRAQAAALRATRRDTGARRLVPGGQTEVVSAAIRNGDVNAVNYFLGQRYVDAFAKLAESPQQRTLIVPANFAGIAGLVEGVKALSETARRAGGTATPPTQR